MYNNLPIKKIACSRCGTVDMYESVMCNDHGGATSFLRCLKCGHENRKQPKTLIQNLNEPKKIYQDYNSGNNQTF